MSAMNPPPIPTVACAKCGVPTNDIQYVGGIVCKQCWNNQQEKQMSIQLTDELKAEALAVARLYKPLREPLLVGSCVWLGEGQDIDVVVFVDDATNNCGGEQCSTVAYGGMVAYRHGHVNAIAVDDERIWAGWVHAAEVMPSVPKALIADKCDRVAACKKLRELGENQCPSD